MEKTSSLSVSAQLAMNFLLGSEGKGPLVWPGSPRDKVRLRLEQKERDKYANKLALNAREHCNDRQKFIRANNL